MKKSLFKSKVFWLQVIDAATTVLPLVGGVAINQPTLGLILNGLTIGARVLTKGPVYLLRKAAAPE